MKKAIQCSVILLFMLSLIVLPVLANADDDADAFSKYEQQGKVSAIGVCDSMRSTVVHFKSSLYKEMIMLAPVANVNFRFYVVKKESGDEYFIKEFPEAAKTKIRKLSAMDWSVELMPLSYSFFLYIFFPDRKHDCAVGQMK